MHKITVTVDDETYERIADEAQGQDRRISAQARRILRLWKPGDEDRQLKIDDALEAIEQPKMAILNATPPYVNPMPWSGPGVRWLPPDAVAATSTETEPIAQVPGQTDLDDIES